MAKDTPPAADAAALQARITALEAENAALKAAQPDPAEEAEIANMQNAAGVTRNQALEVIRHRREWLKDPLHPDNVAKAAAQAKPAK